MDSDAKVRRSSFRRRSDAPALYPRDEQPEASLQLESLPPELKVLLQPIDVDSSGTVEWEEFLAFALPSGVCYERIRHLWLQLNGEQAGAYVAEVKALSPAPQ
eukprot:2805026-Prymnesium_polylepis.1